MYLHLRIYVAMLKEEVEIIFLNKNIKWPKHFERFIDDSLEL